MLPKRCYIPVLCLINIVVMIYGLTIATVQSIIKSHHPDSSFANYVIWVTIGTVSAVVAVIGFCALAARNKICLLVFAGLLMALCLAQLVVVGLRYNIKIREREQEKKKMQQIFDDEDRFETEWPNIETYLKCCGVENYNDYEEKWDPWLIGYSETCCENKTSPCRDPFPVGCVDRLMEMYDKSELIRHIIFITFACFMFFSCIFVLVAVFVTKKKSH